MVKNEFNKITITNNYYYNFISQFKKEKKIDISCKYQTKTNPVNIKKNISSVVNLSSYDKLFLKKNTLNFKSKINNFFRKKKIIETTGTNPENKIKIVIKNQKILNKIYKFSYNNNYTINKKKLKFISLNKPFKSPEIKKTVKKLSKNNFGNFINFFVSKPSCYYIKKSNKLK